MRKWWPCVAIVVLMVLPACAPKVTVGPKVLALFRTAAARPLDTAAEPAPAADEVKIVQADAGTRLVMFLPDRVLDLLDTVSFGLGIGYGFDIHRQITCGLHIPTLGVYQSFNFINWYHNRNLCWCIRTEEEAGLLPMVAYESTFTGAGTGWDNGEPGEGTKTYRKEAGEGSPDDPIHTEGFRDPWAIGIGYGPVILSPRLELEIHPVELVDFAIGFISLGFIDISEDDLAGK